jgi:3-hydroxybutyryl-CoA dehydrogenase
MRSSLDALSQKSPVGVIGCGTMGKGISQVAAAAGHPVILYDSQTDAVSKAIESVRNTFVRLVSKGKLSADEAEKASTRLRGASSLEDFSGAALIIEAVVEDLKVKQHLFSGVETIVDSECILATNTSSLSITAIAGALKKPQRFLGMHFFNPAPLMELVEVISGVETDPACSAIAYATALGWGKRPVYVKSSPGFIVNRVARPFYGEALLLFSEQAASPATIDAVMREAGGFRMGPFELMDLVGLDVGFAVSQSVFNDFFGDERYRPSLIQQEMVRAGHLGRKTKRGFYDYNESAHQPEPHTESLQPKPARVTLPPGSLLADVLAHRLVDSGIEIDRVPSRADFGSWVEVGNALIAFTDGRSAMQRARETGHRNIVLIDLALDYTKAARLAITKASVCDESAYASSVGLLQAAGYTVSRLKDSPGIAVMRTVAMLVNEAADVVNQGVATVEDVDTAMRRGVNYPRGPLAWADEVGIKTIYNVLANLAAHYSGDRYRISPLIRQMVWESSKFHYAQSNA